jgi:enamine deaminase RidA (YjgF/YER057c/UK114 family)
MDNLSPEQRFHKLNLELPPPPKPMGVYKPYLKVGNLAYISGHGPFLPSGDLIKGRVGLDMDMEAGKEAARQVGLSILSTLQHNLGTLNRIKRVVKVLGMVNATAEFQKHPFVINGCSELFAEVFGEENGVGVRSAVGMGSLPDNIPVEIEAIFELV